MRTHRLFHLVRALLVIILLLAPTLVLHAVQDTPAAPAGTNPESFESRTEVLAGGESVDVLLINGPPTPPAGSERTTVHLLEPNQATAAASLPVPAYNWSFGCSATSAAMIAAYYDRTLYPSMYTGPTNGGVMPMDNSAWPDVVINGEVRHQCPLSATRNGLDGRSTRGQVDDYWIKYNEPGPDPFVSNGWSEHTPDGCTADFMKTNKWFPSQGANIDGGTTFYNFTDGAPLSAAQMESYGIHVYDGGYGIKLFYESRGYLVSTMFNQYIYGYNGNTQGFTYSQYKAEIDAGRPVMIHVQGHTMVGIGYDDSTSNLVYLNDTWDYATHSMVWGGAYSGMAQIGVTVVRLALPPTAVELARLEAVPLAGAVRLEWETVSEVDTLGFAIYRSEAAGDAGTRISGDLIPGQEPGSPLGASYSWFDQEVRAGAVYFYWLEEVGASGSTARYGPLSVAVKEWLQRNLPLRRRITPPRLVIIPSD